MYHAFKSRKIKIQFLILVITSIGLPSNIARNRHYLNVRTVKNRTNISKTTKIADMLYLGFHNFREGKKSLYLNL